MPAISATPAAGSYNDVIVVRLTHPNKIYYCIDGDIPEFGTWQFQTPLPGSARSHATAFGTTHVVGGTANNAAVSSHFVFKQNSWTNEINYPLALKSSAAATNIVSGGQAQTKATLVSEFELGAWRSRCPLPVGLSEHNLAYANGKYYALNGSSEIYEYDPIKDSWSVCAKNPFHSQSSACSSIQEKIYFTQHNLFEFNPKTKTTSSHILGSVEKGASAFCNHNDGFSITGGHGAEIKNDVFRFDVIKRTVTTNPPAPIPGAYMASSNHSTVAGLQRENANLEYLCPKTWIEYIEPICLSDNKSYKIAVVAVDKNNKIIEKSVFEYNISFNQITLAIDLFNWRWTKFVWPQCRKTTGEEFSIKDLVPEIGTLLVQENQIKQYSLSLLEEYPNLNKKLVAGQLYQIRLSESNVELKLEVHGTLQKTYSSTQKT